MDYDEDEHPELQCEVCEGTDFRKELGHYYCTECQTQSQAVREHVLEQDGGRVQYKGTKKIQKKQPELNDDKLTSWECYNRILRGLVQELLDLGAKPQLKKVVRCLWMKYLHKCEVFSLNNNAPPKLSIVGSRKDAAVLYNIKKRKRKQKRASSVSTDRSTKRQRSLKKRALVNSQYQASSQSEQLDTSVLTVDTLSSIKSGSEGSTSSFKMEYNRFSKKEMKSHMSKRHLKRHQEDLHNELDCHKFLKSNFRDNFSYGPSNLTAFTLYAILYLALLIIRDAIQLGDLLRFIREGHVSFACYRHFFASHQEKTLNLPIKNDKLYSQAIFRKKAAKLAKFLDITSYIVIPNLEPLLERYCSELNLPEQVLECSRKFLLKMPPKMTVRKQCIRIPNYEARAMSFILFTLKLLYGLDGVTETKLSDYSDLIGTPKMFNINQWLQYVAYRQLLIKQRHLPTSTPTTTDISDIYSNYLQNQRVKFKPPQRQVFTQVKDYLQVLEDVMQEVTIINQDETVFEPSLTPFKDYSKKLPSNELLSQSFRQHSLDFLLQPSQYLPQIGCPPIKNAGANDNFVTQDFLYLYKRTVAANCYKVSKKTVPVQILSDSDQEDKNVKTYLNQRENSLKTTDTNVLLSNWQRGNQKDFSAHQKLLLPHYSPDTRQNVTPHYNPFERYWLNVPTNPMTYYVSKADATSVIAKLPHSLRLALAECARVVEQESDDIFWEFLTTELYIVSYGNFGCKKSTSKSKEIFEIKSMLKKCARQW